MGRTVATIAMMTMFLGCSGAAPTSADGVTLAVATPFEGELVGPLLQEIRAGVRPFDDQGLGICRGAHECEEYLGRELEEPLGPGEYGLFAALRVPPVGEPGTWSVTVTTTCKGEGSEGSRYTREHELVAPPGKAVRPFRLLLQRITSPSPEGPRSCEWSVVAPHPDQELTWSGSWSTP